MRKKYYKFLALLISILLLFPVFSACGDEEDNDPLGRTTIRIAHWDADGEEVERAVLEIVVSAFQNKYPDYRVKIDIVTDYENVYYNKLRANDNIHDVFLVPDGNFAQWVLSGRLKNLKEFVENSELLDFDDMYPGAIDRYRFDGSVNGRGDIYALPKDVGPQVLYYNVDMVNEYNATAAESDKIVIPVDRPMTIAEASEVFRKLTVKEGNEVIRYGLTHIDPEGLVWSAGGDFLDADRLNATLQTEPVKRAYSFLQDAIVGPEPFMPDGSFKMGMSSTTLFALQKCAATVSGRWSVTSFRNLDFNWDIAFVPSFEENPYVNAWSGSVGYAIYSGITNQKKLEGAWKLIEYIASPEGQMVLTGTGFNIPLYESIALDPDLVASEKALGPKNYEIFVESAKHQRAGLWQYLPSQRWKTHMDTASASLFHEDPSERITVDQFLANMQSAVNQIIRQDHPDRYN